MEDKLPSVWFGLEHEQKACREEYRWGYEEEEWKSSTNRNAEEPHAVAGIGVELCFPNSVRGCYCITVSSELSDEF